MIKKESRKPKKWRLLNTGTGSAWFNMALDEAIFICVKKGIVPPTLRFYTWDAPAVSLGYFQPTNEIRKIFGSEIDFVRRITGGGAVYHSPDLTYSLVVDRSHGWGVREFSWLVSNTIASGLRGLGVGCRTYLRNTHEDLPYNSIPNSAYLCFSQPQDGDVVVDGKKLAGGAQRRGIGAVLYQGSILIEKPGAFPDLFEKSISLKELVNGRYGKPQAFEMLRSGFARQFRAGIECGSLHPEEEGIANELLKKYQSSTWNSRY